MINKQKHKVKYEFISIRYKDIEFKSKQALEINIYKRRDGFTKIEIHYPNIFLYSKESKTHIDISQECIKEEIGKMLYSLWKENCYEENSIHEWLLSYYDVYKYNEIPPVYAVQDKF